MSRSKSMYIGLEASYKKHIEYVPYNQGGLKFILESVTYFFMFRIFPKKPSTQ
jgi:hypothetical protein